MTRDDRGFRRARIADHDALSRLDFRCKPLISNDGILAQLGKFPQEINSTTMSLNQRVPGSSPGAPTIQSTETRRGRPACGKAYFRPVFRDREASLASLRIGLVS
jgi:hypothetical protein